MHITRVILSRKFYPLAIVWFIGRNTTNWGWGVGEVTVWGVEKLTASACKGRWLTQRRQAKTAVNHKRFDSLAMDDDCLLGCLPCCIVLIVLVSLTTGVPCLFYGYKCKNAELRAEHKSDHCKNIHNNSSAKALQAFGWIFSIPWLIAALYILIKVFCDSDNSSVYPENESPDGGSIHVVVCFWK